MNTFRLKDTVAASDSDLAALRAWRGYPALCVRLQGAQASAGAAALPGAATAKLRAEARAPFRLLRLFLAGGLGGGAALAGLVTLPALLKAALDLGSAAADSQPDASAALQAACGNAAVDAAVLAASVLWLQRELRDKASAEALAEREEALGLLRVVTGGDSGGDSGPGAAVSSPLAALRSRYRPLLLVGSQAHLRGCARAAEPHKRELAARGVLLVALAEGGAQGADAPAAPKPRGFGAPPSTAAGAASAAEDCGGWAAAFSANTDAVRWRADAFDAQAWRDWAQQARAQAELPPGQPFYVALALDGTVRRSAAGAPKWEDIVDEFQTLTATATKLTGY